MDEEHMLKQGWNIQRKIPYNLLLSIIILIFVVTSSLLIIIIEVPVFYNTKNEIFEEMAYAHHISIAPNSNNIVVGTANGFVKLYNFTSSKKLRIIDFKERGAFAGSINDVEWSPDGNQFAISGGYDFRRGGRNENFIRVYTKTGDLLIEKQLDFSIFKSNIDWSSDNNKILYGSKLNLIIWDIEEDSETIFTQIPFDPENPRNGISFVDWSFDDNLIVYADAYDNSVVIVNATNGIEIDRLFGYRGAITWKPNEYNLYLITDYLSDNFNKEIRMWNYSNGNVTTLQSDTGLDLKDIQSLEFSPDGSKILIRSITNNVDIGFIVIDSTSFQIIFDDFSVAGSSYSWSDDGNLIMAGAQDGSVHVWAGNTGNYQTSLPALDIIQWVLIILSIGIIGLFIISIFFKKCFGSIPMLLGVILMINGFLIEAGDTTLRNNLYLSIFFVGLILLIWGYLTLLLHGRRSFFSTTNLKKIHSHIYLIQSILLVIFAIYIAYFQFFEGNIWSLFNDRNPLNYSNFYHWGAILLILGLIWPIIILIKIQAKYEIDKEIRVNAVKRALQILVVGLPIFLFFSLLFLTNNRVYVIIPFSIAFVLIPILSTTVYMILTQIDKKAGDRLSLPDYCVRFYLIASPSALLIWGALTILLFLIIPRGG